MTPCNALIEFPQFQQSLLKTYFILKFRNSFIDDDCLWKVWISFC